MKNSRWLLGLSVSLIGIGVGWFILSLPQAKPLVDWLWSINASLLPMEEAAFRSVSTFVNNLWKGVGALPVSLRIALVGLILLAIFALQQYAQRLGRSVVDILPPPLDKPLRWLQKLRDGVIYLLSQRLAATAFLVLTFLMIVYFALAIFGAYTGAFGFAQPTQTPTPFLTATPLPQMPRELWDGKYAEENRLGTPPTEIAVRQAIAARDSALTNFRRWLKGEVNWSSAELRLKMNDADAARTYFFQNVGAYPEAVWSPRVKEVRTQLDEQQQYLRGLLDVMLKAEAKDWNGALTASLELDRTANFNIHGEVEQAIERSKRTPTPTPTIAVVIILPSVTPSATPTRTPIPTHTPIPTRTPTPTITRTPTPDVTARMIVSAKDAVTNRDWNIASYIVGELNRSLASNDPRRPELVNWLTERADDPLLYVEPPSEPAYRPTVSAVCLSYRITVLALTLDGDNAKALRIRGRVNKWLDYYSTEFGREVTC